MILSPRARPRASLIDVIEVDGTQLRIKGSNDVLKRAVPPAGMEPLRVRR